MKVFYSAIQSFIKRLFFGADGFLHLLLARADFGEDVAHRVSEHVHEFVEERFVEAERAAVTHRATQDAAQNVVAVGVAGLDAVGNRKTQRADVVGDDAEGNVERDLFRARGRDGKIIVVITGRTVVRAAFFGFDLNYISARLAGS